MVTEINFDHLEVGLGFRVAIELILVAIQWLVVLLTSRASNGNQIVANCSGLGLKSMPFGWPMTIETNSGSHLCRFHETPPPIQDVGDQKYEVDKILNSRISNR
jgi:hypothetical protein